MAPNKKVLYLHPLFTFAVKPKERKAALIRGRLTFMIPMIYFIPSILLSNSLTVIASSIFTLSKTI